MRQADAQSSERSAAGLLGGYSGAALLVRVDGTVTATNGKGESVELLLRHNAVPEILALVRESAAAGSIAVGSLSLTGTAGEIILHITVVPMGEGDFLILARDMTLERNLRSVLVESRQRYKDLVEVSSDFAWEMGPDGMFAFVSPRGAMGYKADQLVGYHPRAFVHDPDEYDPLPFLSDRPLEDVEVWLRRADGNLACAILSCLPLFTDEGEWRGSRGICRDVTDEREREAALTRAHHREQLLNYIVNTIRDEVEPLNMLTTAAGAAARALGAAGCRIYRRTEAGVFDVAAEHGSTVGIGDLEEFLARLDNNALEERVGPWQILGGATHYRQTVNGAICMWKSNDTAWDSDHHILIGDVANQLGIANEQISNHERILKLSRTDGLTGLLNRRAFFEDEVPRRMNRLEISLSGAALMYVDMDNFKRVNDVHGHQIGDDAILALRDMMAEHSRPGDVIARLGGDEFAMWLDGITAEAALRRAEALIDSTRSLRKFSGDDDHPLGISVGIAVYNPAVEEELDNLVARADEAMYAVKNSGKGGCKVSLPPGGTARP